jgi:hypothetical protein
MNFEALETTQAKAPPFPQKVVDFAGNEYTRLMHSLRDAWGELIEAFDSLPLQDQWRRRAVKQFVAGPEVGKVEKALDREFYFLRTDPDEERRAVAAQRIGEGVEYLRKVILHKIGGGK